MVDSMPWRTSGQVSRLCIQANRSAPTAPIAPASVGVARPRKMVPSTTKISASEGTIPHSTRRISGQPRKLRACGGIGGIEADEQARARRCRR